MNWHILTDLIKIYVYKQLKIVKIMTPEILKLSLKNNRSKKIKLRQKNKQLNTNKYASNSLSTKEQHIRLIFLKFLKIGKIYM